MIAWWYQLEVGVVGFSCRTLFDSYKLWSLVIHSYIHFSYTIYIYFFFLNNNNKHKNSTWILRVIWLFSFLGRKQDLMTQLLVLDTWYHHWKIRKKCLPYSVITFYLYLHSFPMKPNTMLNKKVNIKFSITDRTNLEVCGVCSLKLLEISFKKKY